MNRGRELAKASYLFLMAVLILVAASPPTKALPYRAANSSVPSLITDYVEIVNTKSTVTNNVTIDGGGTLVIRNSELTFIPGEGSRIEIYVNPGGRLLISNSTLRGIWNKPLSIYVDTDGYIEFNGSTFINLGWKVPENTDEYIFPGAGFTHDLSRRGHGIEIAGYAPVFKNNHFVNISSIRFYSNNIVVEGNTITNPKHEGFAFFGSNNKVVNNTIVNSYRQYYEIHGIRFYPGSNNNVIKNNYIEGVAVGLTISQIDPWTKNYNYTIRNNRITNVFIGMNILGKNIKIENNTIMYSFANAVFINDCEDILIEGNRLMNYTYVIPEMYSDEYWSLISHLFPNRAWYEFFIMQRGGILIGWRAVNISIINNMFEFAPLFGYAVGFDIRYIATDIWIVNNTFRHIADGYYLESSYISEPNLYSVPLADVGKANGAAIELESSTNVYILNNRFIDTANGISTAFPDAIGNYGNLTIENNVFIGPNPRSWLELYTEGIKPIIGIGIGTAAFNPDENINRSSVYYAPATMTIRNNTLINYIYPIVIDNKDPSLKTFIVQNNEVNIYFKIVNHNAVIDENANILRNKVAPNLASVTLEVNPSSPSASETVTISATIEVTNYTMLSMLYRKQPLAGLYIDGQLVKSIRITGDGVLHLSYSWIAAPGDHQIKVEVDPQNSVDETDETDNVKILTISVSTPPSGGEEQSPPPSEGGESEPTVPTEPTKPTNSSYYIDLQMILAIILVAVIIVVALALYRYVSHK